MEQICPGHHLDSNTLDWGSCKYARLRKWDFLGTAVQVTREARTLPEYPESVFGAENPERAYEEAADAGDWNSADKIYLDHLKLHYPAKYDTTLKMEALAREFSMDLATKVSESPSIYRWMDLGELWSYRKGTFESETDDYGNCRGCKPFSLGPNPYARRPVSMIVHVDETVRHELRPAAYTALPWPILPKDEDINSRKHLIYAEETECRVPDGTCMPDGTRIFVQEDALKVLPDRQDYYELLRSLKDIATIRLI